jgi:hypothetical protein
MSCSDSSGWSDFLSTFEVVYLALKHKLDIKPNPGATQAKRDVDDSSLS